ncbi:MAG: family 43 glycosylhydrolase [Lachnospiraceae bacterium]|nr:family 43 glycosylhydrolase [Lachnospiraceae bacterium]
MKAKLTGANPYMPLWEHIPDGEPRVFTYNGETRVYVYGSHDSIYTEYCGYDYVVWSAPADDLTKWKCHGVCYRATYDTPMYAPDVVYKDGMYYMYVAEDRGTYIYVAKSETPWGPFTDPVLTDLKFDPGVLVDDDGRVYAYWGFCESYAAELNDDMATIKEGTLVEHLIGHADSPWVKERDHLSDDDAFFEASSPRKIGDKYLLIYSKRHQQDMPELGVYGPNFGFLSYMWSDTPLGGFKRGGDISFNGGEIVPDTSRGGRATPDGIDGRGLMTFQWGNNHGSLMKVLDQWYIFYHRQTGIDEFSRQAMIEPVDVAIGKDGHPYVGRIRYENGEPVESLPVEMTSQGAYVNGIDAYLEISAGYACHMYDGTSDSVYTVSCPGGISQVARDRNDEDLRAIARRKMVIVPVYTPDSGLSDEMFKTLKEKYADGLKGVTYTDFDIDKKPTLVYDTPGEYSSPVMNIADGATIGFKYLQFGDKGPSAFTVRVMKMRSGDDAPAGNDLRINVRIGSYTGDIIGSVDASVTDEMTGYTGEVNVPVTGKHAVYFEFVSGDAGARYVFDSFTFD